MLRAWTGAALAAMNEAHRRVNSGVTGRIWGDKGERYLGWLPSLKSVSPRGLWCRRIDAFELWCWRRLLRVPWTAKRFNQYILKEISPEQPLKGLMLKLKFQYFGHLMRRTDSCEKTLMLGKIEGGRKKGLTEDEMVGWHHQLNGHEFE